ncbi:MAG: phosphatidate cytidylyltransferase [Bifidobacterium bifidum]
MPQAVAYRRSALVAIISAMPAGPDPYVFVRAGGACSWSRALWELRVDFATVGLHIPVVALWLCSGGHHCCGTLLTATYHFGTMALLTMATADSRGHSAPPPGSASGNWLVARRRMKLDNEAPDARQTRRQSSFNHEKGELHHSRLSHVAVSILTVLYIPTLASCIVLSLVFNGHPVAHAITLVFLPALSDTGGLFFGAWFGKHKLSPRISPKKSVEGLFGSILFAMIGAFAVFFCTYDGAVWASRWWVPIVMGVLTGVAGTFGDLCASMLKRDIGIKDMGHLLKGHGGVMDRVDSILMCAPFLAGLLWIVGM